MIEETACESNKEMIHIQNVTTCTVFSLVSLGPKVLDNPPLTPYYSPGGYPGKAANNVKLPL